MLLKHGENFTENNETKTIETPFFQAKLEPLTFQYSK